MVQIIIRQGEILMLNKQVNIDQKIEYGSNNNQAGRDININNYIQNSKKILLENIPNCTDDYISRTEIEEELIRAINTNNIVQIYGISGIGKTELMKYVLSKLEHIRKFWIACDDGEEGIDLSNIQTLSGKSINLLEKINIDNIMIVIDNYNGRISEICNVFNENNYNKSKMIVISKEKSIYTKVSNVLVDNMTCDEAKKIFKSTELDDEIIDNLLKNMDKHPMTLKIIKNYIAEDNGISLSDIERELQSIVDMKDKELSSSQRICEKIIGYNYQKSPELYKLLSLIDSNIIESEFLKRIILEDIQLLINKNFIQYQNEYYYMHSIIKDSIKSMVNRDKLTEEAINCYKNRILSFLKEKIDNRDLGFYRFGAYNYKFLQNLQSIVSDKYYRIIILNCFIIINNYHDKKAIVEEIKKLLKEYSNNDYYSIKLLIEEYEMERSFGKDFEEKNKISLQKIDLLNELKNNEFEFRINQLINQRIAKFYNWTNQYDKAIKILEQIITINKDAYSAILQLCRAYRSKILQDKVASLDYEEKIYCILKELEFKKIPMSIFLEIIKVVIYRPFNNEKILKLCLWDNMDMFKEYVKLYSSSNIFEHVYIIMSNLASNLYYNESSFYKQWFDEVVHPDIMKCNNELLLAMIKIYCYEIKRRTQSNENYDNILNITKGYWYYYKEIKKKINKFDYKAMLDCLISVKEFDLAKSELLEIFDENDIWHLRYMSQIEEGSKNYKEALTYIEKVIIKCGNSYHKQYYDTFLKDKSRLLEFIVKSN